MSSRRLTRTEARRNTRQEIERSLWLKDYKSRVVPLESDLASIFENSRYREPIEIQTVQNESLPGFTRYIQHPKSMTAPKRRRDVAYRCGECHMAISGSPEIKPVEGSKGLLQYNCTICDSVLEIFDGRKDDPRSALNYERVKLKN